MFKSHLAEKVLLVQLPLLIDRHEDICQCLVEPLAVPMALIKQGCLVPATAAAALLLINLQLQLSISDAVNRNTGFQVHQGS
jgi:hypothetical protein